MFTCAISFIFVTAAIGTYACSSKSFAELPRYHDTNPKVIYKMQDTIEYNCDTKYDKLAVSTSTQLNSQPLRTCLSGIPPGLSIMQHGFNYLYPVVPSNYVDVTFICDGTNVHIEDSIYKIPNNMTFTLLKKTEYRENWYDQKTIGESYFSSDDDDASENILTHLLTYQAVLKANQMQRFRTLQVRHVVYKASISSIKPSRNMLFWYRSINENLELNEDAYMKFIDEFGSGIRVDASFGGFIEVWVKNEHFEEFTSIVDDALLRKNSDKYEIIIQEGGGTAENFDSWVKSLQKNPLPLFSKVLPIYEYIEPGSNSRKKQSFQQMMKHIENTVFQRRILAGLESLKSSHRLPQFLIAELTSNVDYICPSESLVQTLRKGIIDGENYYLKQYGLQCTHDRWYSTSDKEEIVIIRDFKLISGLCLTKRVPFTTCLSPQIFLPPGVKCVKFYLHDDCMVMLCMYFQRLIIMRRHINCQMR